MSAATIQTTRKRNTMSTLEESLARAQVKQRLEEARQRRLATHLLAARRLTRKAEKAAAEARLVLARAI